VLRIFIALKYPSPWPGLNPQPSGPVASTLTTTPPKATDVEGTVARAIVRQNLAKQANPVYTLSDQRFPNRVPRDRKISRTSVRKCL
jgi:hypothetical protein